MKHEITHEGENLRLKLGMRYDVTFPKTTDLQELIQIVDLLVNTTVGVSVLDIVDDCVAEMQKDG